MNLDPALAEEIARIEGMLRGTLEELAARLNSGKRGADTDDLVQHCREMVELLTDAVARLGEGAEANPLRAAVAHMAAQLAALERELAQRGLH